MSKTFRMCEVEQPNKTKTLKEIFCNCQVLNYIYEMSNKEQSIIFPIFEECKTFTLDSFWRDEFSKLACNRFPPGLRYDAHHHNLVLKLDGKKTEVLALPENDAAGAFQIVMKILKGRYDMRSSRDLKIQKKVIEDAMKKREMDLNCEFKDIKPRQLKDQLIMDYLTSLKTKHHLANSEFRQLISVVQLGFQFKNLSPGDVVYDTEKGVSDIHGLKFDDKTRMFVTPHSQSWSSSKTEKGIGPDRFYSCLRKFIHDDNSRVKKFS